MPTAPIVPTTGAGGTYLYSASSPHGVTFSQSAAPSKGSLNVSRLPATGGGAGTPNPASPLAPLGLLGALAVVAGSVFNRLRKR